ncbi:MAG: hypothetical protein AAFX99_08685 [Myxococcota bacterium]
MLNRSQSHSNALDRPHHHDVQAPSAAVLQLKKSVAGMSPQAQMEHLKPQPPLQFSGAGSSDARVCELGHFMRDELNRLAHQANAHMHLSPTRFGGELSYVHFPAPLMIPELFTSEAQVPELARQAQEALNAMIFAFDTHTHPGSDVPTLPYTPMSPTFLTATTVPELTQQFLDGCHSFVHHFNGHIHPQFSMEAAMPPTVAIEAPRVPPAQLLEPTPDQSDGGGSPS